MQAPQLHTSGDGSDVARFRGAVNESGVLEFPDPPLRAKDCRFPRDLKPGLTLGRGVRSLFTWGEKSWSGGVEDGEEAFSSSRSWSSEFLSLPGDFSSSILFLFFSLLALGEKKERMSCCFSFSN